MFRAVSCLFLFFVVAVACQASASAATQAGEPAAATAEVAAATETPARLDILRDPDLRKLIYFYGRFSREERERIRAQMRKPGVREQVRKILEDPDRLKAIRDERPELYRRFREHRDLQMQYWELLKQYHESREENVRQELKRTIRKKLIDLVDAETAWYKGELERLEHWIKRLEKGLEERLAHRDDLIRTRLKKDLETLPPPPRFRPGPEERGPGRGPRGPRGGPGSEDARSQHRGGERRP